MRKGFFIDDAEKDRDIGLKLNSDELEVTYLKPDKSVVDFAEKDILAGNPDFIAVDYRLDQERDHVDSPNRYKAGPLAQHLREVALEDINKDFPIILVSHEVKIRNDFAPDLTAHDLFDRFYSKEEISTNAGRCQAEIFGLVLGYEALKEKWDFPNKLAVLLNATDDELIEIDQQPLKNIDRLKAPHQIIRGFLRYFIDRSGILLDDNNLLAQWGIKSNSEGLENLYRILIDRNINYSGPLAIGWKRWWSQRLNVFAQELCGENIGNLNAEQRIACINDRLGLNLTPAVSRWTNRTDVLFAFSCASCSNPTEREHSVAAYDPLPHYGLTMQKRICWKCVQTGEYLDASSPLTIHEDDQSITDKIASGEIE